jgi:hypothetical protein
VSERVNYRVASAAGRQALERSMSVKLSDGQRRVLESVVALTALYSKRVDEVAVSQIIRFTGLSKPTVLSALHKLKRLGLIVYEPPPPHSGRGRTSLIGLPAADKGMVNPDTSPFRDDVLVNDMGFTNRDDKLWGRNGKERAEGMVKRESRIGKEDSDGMVKRARSDSSHREVEPTEKTSTEKEKPPRADAAMTTTMMIASKRFAKAEAKRAYGDAYRDVDAFPLSVMGEACNASTAAAAGRDDLDEQVVAAEMIARLAGRVLQRQVEPGQLSAMLREHRPVDVLEAVMTADAHDPDRLYAYATRVLQNEAKARQRRDERQ